VRLFLGGGARWSAWSARVFRPSRPPSGLFPRSNLHVFDKVFLSYLPLLPASASAAYLCIIIHLLLFARFAPPCKYLNGIKDFRCLGPICFFFGEGCRQRSPPGCASSSGGCSPCNRWLVWRPLLTSHGGNGGPTARASSSGGCSLVGLVSDGILPLPLVM
jgi:hypothetical protein